MNKSQAMKPEDRIAELEAEVERLRGRAIGRCQGCGYFVVDEGGDHTMAGRDRDGEPYPMQCGPVDPVTAGDVEDALREIGKEKRDLHDDLARVTEERDRARHEAEMALDPQYSEGVLAQRDRYRKERDEAVRRLEGLAARTIVALSNADPARRGARGAIEYALSEAMTILERRERLEDDDEG